MENKIEIQGLAKQVLDDIEYHGGKVYLVGGIVRDSFFSEPLDYHDVDVEVYHLELDELKDILVNYGVVNEIGKSFGILKINTLPEYDFALPRLEIKTGNRHQDFEVIINKELTLKESSKRRDFTMNALLYEYQSGEIYDFYGGVDDIEKRCIRMVDTDTFKEDPLRVLRAAQFASRFNLDIDEELKKVCLEMVQNQMLTHLSDERIYQEYCKLLMAKKPSIGLQFLLDIKALPECIMNMKNTIQRKDYHPEGNVFNHTLLVVDLAAKVKDKASDPLGFMWASFLHDIGKPIVTTASGHAKGHPEAGCIIFDQQLRWLIKNDSLRRYIKTLIFYHMHFMNMARHQSRDAAYLRVLKGIENILPVEDLILITICDKMGRLRDGSKDIEMMNSYLKEKMDRLGKTAVPAFITGKDLIDQGYKPTKGFKEILNECYNMQLEGMNKTEILDRIGDKYGTR